MSLSDSEKEKLKALIAEYNKSELFFWDEENKNKFRQWYYEIFLEPFGQSRRCWVNSIKKLSKSIEP